MTFGGCCHLSHPPGAALGFRWPGHPILVVTVSLSPQGHSQGGEEWGTEASRWSGTVGHGRGPLSFGVPQPALLSLWPGERCPQAVPAQGSGCLWHRRVPTQWRATLSPTWGHNILPTGTAGTSQALASNVHEERGGGQGCPILGEQMDVTVPWGQRRGLSGWQGTHPRPRGQRGGHTPTFPHAGQGQGELPHEVVAGGAVVVLHHEAHQGQLGRPQLEAQRLLPARVEAYGTGTGGGRCHRGHRGHPPPQTQGLA